MKWFSIKKYIPYNGLGTCLVMTDDDDIYLAKFDYWDEADEFMWIEDILQKPLSNVTHFCVIEPVEI